MEFLKRLAFVVLALLIVGGALTFHFMVGAKAKARRDAAWSKVQSQLSELKSKARDVPDPGMIEKVKQQARLEQDAFVRCQEYMGRQPCEAFQRPFFKSEDPTHPDYGVPFFIERQGEPEPYFQSYLWLDNAYRPRIQELNDIFVRTQTRNWTDRYEPWGVANLPTLSQARVAEEMYWFQFFFAELFADQVEYAFKERIAQLVVHDDWDNPDWPTAPEDLVLSSPGTLDKELRKVDPDKLQKVLLDIIINENEMDLAAIFDAHLADEENPDNDFSWKDVTELIISDEQERFINLLRTSERLPARYSTGLSYHDRFITFLRGLRTVRYRRDVEYLLRQYAPELLTRLEELESAGRRSQSNVVRPRLSAMLSTWGSTRLATIIANIVCLRHKEDYTAIRDNHRMNIASIVSMEVQRPWGKDVVTDVEDMTPEMRRLYREEQRMGGPRLPGGQDGTMEWEKDPLDPVLTPFSMRIIIEFERVTVFVRALLNMSWNCNLRIRGIQPAQRRMGPGGISPERMPRTTTGPRMSPRRSPLPPPSGPGDMLPPGGRLTPGARRALEEETPYVEIQVDAVAKQYVKQLEAVRARDKAERARSAREAVRAREETAEASPEPAGP
jgi:hypothetical protein